MKNKPAIENLIPQAPVYNEELDKMAKNGATTDALKKKIEQFATLSADNLADKKTDLWAWDTEFKRVYDELFGEYCV